MHVNNRYCWKDEHWKNNSVQRGYSAEREDFKSSIHDEEAECGYCIRL